MFCSNTQQFAINYLSMVFLPSLVRNLKNVSS